jgi:RimJ/RimL family protein N-acetyltransferase
MLSTWPSPDRFDPQPTLRGELLHLRPLREADFGPLFAVASDPLIWEQHPNSDRYNLDVFRAFFREAMDRGGALAVLDAATGEIIGSSRYHGYDGARSEVEVGWTFLARRYWGGRYNGELKRLMLEHAFRYMDHVIFVIGPENFRSRRAVEKIGAVFHELRVVEQGERCIYRISAPRAATTADSPDAGG